MTWSTRLFGVFVSCLLLLFITGKENTVLIAFILSVPVVGFFGWIQRKSSAYGLSPADMKQIRLFFLIGMFPTPLLAMGLQSILVIFWIFVCFADQQESLVKQLKEQLDKQKEEDSHWSSSSGSNSGSSFSSGHSSAIRLSNLFEQLEIKHTFGYYFFFFTLAYCVAALVEEGLKLWIVRGTCCCGCSSSSSDLDQPRSSWCHPNRISKDKRRRNNWRFIYLCVMAGALGFSFMENIGYTMSVAQGSDTTEDTSTDQLNTALLRIFLSTPVHCICGGITGIRLAASMRDSSNEINLHHVTSTGTSNGNGGIIGQWISMAKLLGPAIFLHGSFDFELFLLTVAAPTEWQVEHEVLVGALSFGLSLLLLLIGSYYLYRLVKATDAKDQGKTYAPITTTNIVDLESGLGREEKSPVDQDGVVVVAEQQQEEDQWEQVEGPPLPQASKRGEKRFILSV